MVGDPDTAFAGAAKVIEADYEIPFQGHTAISPAHATADPSNGQMTIYSNDMKSYGMRRGVATFLGMPREQVRVVWMEGPQGFGRTAADDAGCEAAYIAQRDRPAGSRPVDAERRDGVGYQGPAFAGQDARRLWMPQGNLVALRLQCPSRDYNHLGYNEPDTVLIAQLMGSRRATPAAGSAATAFGNVRDSPSPDGRRGGEPAAGVGDAASHRKPARSQWSAIDVCRRIVHRRSWRRRRKPIRWNSA